ncbi:MAG: VCBS repeat-containing protein [Verrucomicrobiales bacterium]|nr:VCBS repeat-containing protein [Verrucomicrobiales bacterium]
MPRLLSLLMLAAVHGFSDDSVLPPLAVKYCSACHLPPGPDSITRKYWPKIFGFMETWTVERGLPLDKAEFAELLDYYVANSPEAFEPVPDELEESLLMFEKGDVGVACTSDRPKITNVNITDLDGNGKSDVLICDAVAGRVSWLVIEDGTWKETFLAEVVTPVKATVVDYNRDGQNDIVVASLGDISPTDDPIGSVSLLINRGDMTFESMLLIGGVARVADVKSGDFNGDGKTDFIVAQFGWRKTGGLLWLEQVTPKLFLQHEILPLNGAMQLEVLDFDGDGVLDFVVLFSQEHESIVLFKNDGWGGFESRILARAPHPGYGSSGFQMVDLDKDGDIDILCSNGDMMDEISLVKPYHGVRWFENTNGEFHPKELVRMPGSYRAVAHDMNGDGHLDVVVSSLNFYWNDNDFPSLIWLENDGHQNFTPRSILYSPTNLATMDVGDLNHDGIPDIVVGGMHIPGPLGRDARVTAIFGTGKIREKKH